MKKAFCSHAHTIAWRASKEGRDLARYHLSHNVNVQSEASRKKRAETGLNKLRMNDFSMVKSFSNVDLDRAHTCRYSGCNRTVLCIWDYCDEHMKETKEMLYKNRAYYAFWKLKDSKTRLPLEFVLTMYLLVKTKEVLNGYRSN
jgi:hypothetical protein